jgi:hypothetical protein
LLVFAASLSLAQESAPAQLTQVPQKPSCTPLLRNGSCADLWKNYNTAVLQRTREELQLYVSRQKEMASAPLQQQIADLTKLSTDQQNQIKSLQEQMQADSAAALVEKSAAHRDGLEYGGGIGAGVMLLIFGLIFGLRNFNITKKPQARAASA